MLDDDKKTASLIIPLPHITEPSMAPNEEDSTTVATSDGLTHEAKDDLRDTREAELDHTLAPHLNEEIGFVRTFRYNVGKCLFFLSKTNKKNPAQKKN